MKSIVEVETRVQFLAIKRIRTGEMMMKMTIEISFV